MSAAGTSGQLCPPTASHTSLRACAPGHRRCRRRDRQTQAQRSAEPFAHPHPRPPESSLNYPSDAGILSVGRSSGQWSGGPAPGRPCRRPARRAGTRSARRRSRRPPPSASADAAQRRQQPLLAEAPVLRRRCRSRRRCRARARRRAQGDALGASSGVRPGAEHRAEVPDRRAASPSRTSSGCGMAGAAAPPRSRSVRRDVDQRDRARRQLRPLRERAVELLERGVRVAEQHPGGAQRVARLAGQRRGLGAAAGDVADQQHPAGRASGRRRRSRRRRGSPRPPGGTARRAAGPAIAGSSSGSRPRWSVAAMCERSCVQAGVLDRGAGPAAELLGQLEVGLA